MIGIIGAMSVEVEQLKKRMVDPVKKVISGIEFISGTLDGAEAVAAKCGIGKGFAAICTQTMILNYKPDAIINTGVAGTLTKKLSVLDVAVSSAVVQHDMDTSPLGDPEGLIPGFENVEIYADNVLKKQACQAINSLGVHCETGVIASGDCFVASKEKKQHLVTQFSAIACEMESGTIAQTCCINNVPFVIIRAISDSADGAAEMDYPAFVDKAAVLSQKIVLALMHICAENDK